MTDPRLVRPQWRDRTNVDTLTIACIEHAERLAGHEFIVTQGSYQPPGGGDLNSAGTHDRGGVVDLRWCGHPACISHLRRAGMFAWLRTPAQGPWPYHIHAGVVGHPLLAPLAAVQEAAYKRGFNGLGASGQGGPDDGPRIVPIPVPVWPPVMPGPTRARRAKARKGLTRWLDYMTKHRIPGRNLVRRARKATHRKK